MVFFMELEMQRSEALLTELLRMENALKSPSYQPHRPLRNSEIVSKVPSSNPKAGTVESIKSNGERRSILSNLLWMLLGVSLGWTIGYFM
jgi:hypothetical protein